MARPNIVPIDQPREFGIDELFFSTTDPSGNIIAGNRVFSRVSGYEVAEIAGQPHNMIRHPDMPRSVFKLFWDHLNAGQAIAAYVKNMAKDGRHYWVVATATPYPTGHLSVRFKPSSALFPKVEKIYAELRGIERAHEADDRGQKAGMAASGARLGEILAGLGFGSYDSFMHAMLATELKSRGAALAGKARSASFISGHGLAAYREIGESCVRLRRFLDELFEHLDLFVALNKQLGEKSRFVLELASDIHLSSHNALVASRRLNQGGATLGVVATIMGGHTGDTARLVRDLNEGIGATLSALQEIAFRVSMVKLQAEMAASFIDELVEPSGDAGQVGAASDGLGAITTSLESGMHEVFGVFSRLGKGLEGITRHLEELDQLLRTLEVLQVTGKVEAARIDGASAFHRLFSDVASRVGKAKSEMTDFSRTVATTLSEANRTVLMQGEIQGELARMGRVSIG